MYASMHACIYVSIVPYTCIDVTKYCWPHISNKIVHTQTQFWYQYETLNKHLQLGQIQALFLCLCLFTPPPRIPSRCTHLTTESPATPDKSPTRKHYPQVPGPFQVLRSSELLITKNYLLLYTAMSFFWCHDAIAILMPLTALAFL